MDTFEKGNRVIYDNGKLKKFKITKDNLHEKSLTNREVIEMLNSLSLKVDPIGFSRVLDLIEELTGNREFE